MRGHSDFSANVTSYIRCLPDGYVTELEIKDANGNNLRTEPKPTVAEANVAGRELAAKHNRVF